MDRTVKLAARWVPWLALLGVLLAIYFLFLREPLGYHRWECPTPLADAECGYLTVPVDRAYPLGQKIKVSVAIFKSSSPRPAPDPVVYLNGGPGVAGLKHVGRYIRALLPTVLEDRDLILVEQRGTGFSAPWLDCPELNDVPFRTLAQSLTLPEASAYHSRQALICRDRLTREGINLAAYTSADAAADLADLRQALGYKEWNLYGLSYGTRLALTTMRDHPEGIRSVILDSVYMPPQAEFYAELWPNAAQTFRTLFRLCAQASGCDTAYPQLEDVFLQTIDHLNSRPATFPIVDPLTRAEVTGKMNGPGFVGLLYRLLYNTTDIPRLPDLIYRVHDGDYSLLPRLLTDPLNEPMRYSVGMNHTIHCSEEAPFTTREKVAAAGADPRYQGHYHWDVDVEAFLDFCDRWDRREPNAVENQPVVSAIPTLILAGELDPASPPVHGRLVAQSLHRSYFYEFPGIGHLAVYSTPCAEAMAMAFLNDPNTAPDASCIKDMTEPTFWTRPKP
jgi:pimeloyl-ACP methyl ester carboxylesterase